MAVNEVVRPTKVVADCGWPAVMTGHVILHGEHIHQIGGKAGGIAGHQNIIAGVGGDARFEIVSEVLVEPTYLTPSSTSCVVP